MSRPPLLLTGASGLVGGLLLRRVAESDPGRKIFVIARDPSRIPALPGVHAVHGDITIDRLGLDLRAWDVLAQNVGEIVHCAASTKFTLPLNESRAANLHGTRRVVEFARTTKHLRRLVHVSTVYVAGRASGEMAEQRLLHNDGWFSPYEQSKHEAEQFLFDEAADVPWSIVRLSTIVGCSETGRVSQWNYFHQLFRLIPNNPFKVMPGAPDTPIDLICQKWVTDSLHCLLENPPPEHSVSQLCAGPGESIAAGEAVELAFSLYRRRHGCTKTQPPRFVSLGEFESYVKTLRIRGLAAVSKMAEMLVLYLPHLAVRQSFLNETTNRRLAAGGVSRPSTRDYLPRIVETCLGPA